MDNQTTSLERDISKAKRVFLFGAIFFIAAILIGGLIYGYVRFVEYTPYNLKGETKIFTVRPGENVHQIAGNLEYEGLIKKSFYFEMYVWEKRLGKKLQAGKYMLSAKLSPAEIADIMAKGRVFREEVDVMIPEGANLEQIDETFASAGLIQKGEIKNFSINDSSIVSYKFLDSAREAGAKNLEGFLFPDTYKYEKGVLVSDIVLKMLNNFGLKLDSGLREEIARQGKTIFEIITMASIIEKEVKTFEDMKLVSGILWKRINLDMPLQADATIVYALNGKSKLTLDDLKIDSLYNTYKYKGLPPGPISNPGFNAIKAAIYPEPSDYFYYLSAINDDSRTIFAKTAAEHNKNKQLYLR